MKNGITNDESKAIGKFINECSKLNILHVSVAKRKCCESCKHQFSSVLKCSGCAPNYIKWQPKQH